MNLEPFGSRTLMTIDAYHQYAPFHAELRRKIVEGGSIFYSWANGMGKDFLGQVAYYTLSPLSLLPLLFSEENLTIAMHLMVTLKSILSAVLAAYALERFGKWEDKRLPTPYNVLLALIYSFSGFFAAFYWNVMWLDAMALLPLLLLGLYELSLGHGKWRFVFTLVACLITNYFMGMILLFCAIPIYIALLFMGHRREEWKRALARLGKFLLCALLAIGLSSFLLFPARGSLESTDAIGLTVENPWHFFSRLADVLVQQLMGAEPQVVVHDNPFANAYSGLLPLMLMPLYFAIKEISLKRKITVGVLLVFFYLCMNNEFFDYLIHVFHINKALPHRFAFVYTMLFVLIARRVLLNREQLSIKGFAITIAGIALFAVYSVVIAPNLTQPPKISAALLVVNIIMLAIYAAALLLESKSPKLKKILPMFLLLVVCLELGYNQIVGIERSRTNAARNYTDGADVLAEMREYEDGVGFYRTETLPQITSNDGALYGHKAVATFNSIINLNTSQLLRDLGYPSTAVAYAYGENTPFMESILNIRYVYDRSGREEPYTALHTSGNMSIYENEAVLPVGFMVSGDVLDFDRTDNYEGPFELQNTLASVMLGHETELLHSADMVSYNSSNINLEALPNGRFSYELTEPENLAANPIAEFTFRATYTGKHWLEIDSTHCDIAEIILSEGTRYVELGMTNSILSIGNLFEGETVTVRIYLRYRYSNQLYYYPNGEFGIYMAGLDKYAFNESYSALSTQTFALESYTDNSLSGTISAETDGILFFSVPYGSGWSATVDGEETEPISILNKSFLALQLSEGEHEIILKYQTPDWQKGLIISAVSVLILAAVLIYEKRKVHKKQGGHSNEN